MVQKEPSYSGIFLTYHRNYTQSHLADTVKRATIITGEALSDQSSHTLDYPLVRLQSSCLTVSSELTGTFQLRYINFVVESGKFLTMSADSAVSFYDLTFYGLKEGSKISEALVSATAGSLTIDTVSCYYIAVTGSSLFKLSNLEAFSATKMQAYAISCTNNDGPVINIATGSSSQSISIQHSSFISCSSKQNGGALSITVDHTLQTLTLKDVEFPDCHATQKGGGVYLKVTNIITTPVIDFAYDSGLPSAARGDMVYVVTSVNNFVAYIQNLCRQLPVYAYTMHDNVVYLEQSRDSFNMGELTEPYYVLYSGEGDVECSKQYDRRCATITTALARRQSEGLKSSKLIILRQGTHLAEATYTPIHSHLYFTGETSDATQTVVNISPYTTYASFVISDTGDYVTTDQNPTVYFESIDFVITSGTGFNGAFTVGQTCSLNVVNCEFRLQQDAAALAYSLISNSGTLSIFKSRFHDITLNGAPLLDLNDGVPNADVELLQSEFNTITRSSGNGAVFEDSSTRERSLCVLGCTFTDCIASYGYGGALSLQNPHLTISLSTSEDVSNHPEVTSTRTSFKGCSASYGGAIYYNKGKITFGDVVFTPDSPSADIGTAIYANCPTNIYDLADFATFQNPAPSHGKYVAKIPSLADTFDIFDYVPFVVYLGGSNNARDATDCGTETACRTFTTLYSNLNTAGIYYHQITLDATTHDPESASVTLARDIVGQDIGWTIKQVASLGAVSCFYVGYESSESASIYNLTFRVLSRSQGADFESSLFDVRSGLTLTLSRVGFEMAADESTYKVSKFKYCAISVSDGYLVLNGCSFKGFTLATDPLFDFKQSKTSQGYLVCGSQRTNFTNIVRSYGNGAVFALVFESSSAPSSKSNADDEYDGTFTITNMAFTGCVCENGNGGAIYASISAETKFQVKDVSFTNCQATTTSTSGKAVGGAVYLNMEGAPSFYSFGLSSLTYSGCSADYGNVFFGGSETEDLAYDYYFWSGMVSGNVEDNTFAVAPTSSGDGTSLKIDEKKVKQVQDIKPPEDDDGGLSGAVIAVIVIVVLIVVVAVVIIVICCIRKKSSSSSSSPSNSSSNSSAPASKEEPQEMSYPAAPATDYNNPLYNA